MWREEIFHAVFRSSFSSLFIHIFKSLQHRSPFSLIPHDPCNWSYSSDTKTINLQPALTAKISRALNGSLQAVTKHPFCYAIYNTKIFPPDVSDLVSCESNNCYDHDKKQCEQIRLLISCEAINGVEIGFVFLLLMCFLPAGCKILLIFRFEILSVRFSNKLNLRFQIGFRSTDFGGPGRDIVLPAFS